MEGHIATTRTVSLKTVYLRNGAVFGVGIVVVLLYVFQVNALTVKGFALQDVQEMVQNLEKQNRKIERDIAQLQASTVISEKIAQLGLTLEGKVEYIKVNSEDYVALK